MSTDVSSSGSLFFPRLFFSLGCEVWGVGGGGGQRVSYLAADAAAVDSFSLMHRVCLQ